MRRLFAQVLESLGCEVLEAGNVEDALAASERLAEPIALLVATQQPGDLERRELITTLVRAHPGLKIVVTSGYRLQKDELPAGAVFLPKPFRPEDFTARVREILAAVS